MEGCGEPEISAVCSRSQEGIEGVHERHVPQQRHDQKQAADAADVRQAQTTSGPEVDLGAVSSEGRC